MHFPINKQTDSSKAAGRLPGTSSSRQLSDRNCSRINQPPCWYPEWQPSPLAAVSRSVFYKPETKLYSPSSDWQPSRQSLHLPGPNRQHVNNDLRHSYSSLSGCNNLRSVLIKWHLSCLSDINDHRFRSPEQFYLSADTNGPADNWQKIQRIFSGQLFIDIDRFHRPPRQGCYPRQSKPGIPIGRIPLQPLRITAESYLITQHPFIGFAFIKKANRKIHLLSGIKNRHLLKPHRNDSGPTLFLKFADRCPEHNFLYYKTGFILWNISLFQ